MTDKLSSYYRLPEIIAKSNLINSDEKLILMFIFNYTSNHKECFYLDDFFASCLNKSCKTIQRYLLNLESKNYITRSGLSYRRKLSIGSKLLQLLSIQNTSLTGELSEQELNTSLTGDVHLTHQCPIPHSPVSYTSLTGVLYNKEVNKEVNKEINKGDSIFLPIKTQIQNQLIKHELEPTTDIIAQIEFYVDTKPDQPEDQTIRVAVNLYKKKKWRIPNGYNGITSQSIIKKEEDYYRQEEAQYQEDGKAYRNVIALLPKHAVEDEIKPVANSSDRPSDRPDKPDRKIALQHLSEMVSFLKPSSLNGEIEHVNGETM